MTSGARHVAPLVAVTNRTRSAHQEFGNIRRVRKTGRNQIADNRDLGASHRSEVDCERPGEKTNSHQWLLANHMLRSMPPEFQSLMDHPPLRTKIADTVEVHWHKQGWSPDRIVRLHRHRGFLHQPPPKPPQSGHNHEIDQPHQSSFCRPCSRGPDTV